MEKKHRDTTELTVYVEKQTGIANRIRIPKEWATIVKKDDRRIKASYLSAIKNYIVLNYDCENEFETFELLLSIVNYLDEEYLVDVITYGLLEGLKNNDNRAAFTTATSISGCVKNFINAWKKNKEYYDMDDKVPFNFHERVTDTIRYAKSKKMNRLNYNDPFDHAKIDVKNRRIYFSPYCFNQNDSTLLDEFAGKINCEWKMNPVSRYLPAVTFEIEVSPRNTEENIFTSSEKENKRKESFKPNPISIYEEMITDFIKEQYDKFKTPYENMKKYVENKYGNEVTWKYNLPFRKDLECEPIIERETLFLENPEIKGFKEFHDDLRRITTKVFSIFNRIDGTTILFSEHVGINFLKHKGEKLILDLENPVEKTIQAALEIKQENEWSGGISPPMFKDRIEIEKERIEITCPSCSKDLTIEFYTSEILENPKKYKCECGAENHFLFECGAYRVLKKDKEKILNAFAKRNGEMEMKTFLLTKQCRFQ